jgi:hypothetical protein
VPRSLSSAVQTSSKGPKRSSPILPRTTESTTDGRGIVLLTRTEQKAGRGNFCAGRERRELRRWPSLPMRRPPLPLRPAPTRPAPTSSSAVATATIAATPTTTATATSAPAATATSSPARATYSPTATATSDCATTARREHFKDCRSNNLLTECLFVSVHVHVN